MEAVAAEEAATAAVSGSNLEAAVSKVKATLATVPAKSRLLKRSLKATAADNTKDNSARFVDDFHDFLSCFYPNLNVVSVQTVESGLAIVKMTLRQK